MMVSLSVIPAQAGTRYKKHLRLNRATAIRTKMMTFLIDIFYISGGSHNTVLIMTMDQSEGMTKFVYHLLKQAFIQDSIVNNHAIAFIIKPVHRSDCCKAA